MSPIAVLFLRAITPGLGVLLGLLGFATLDANILGWFLFLAGLLYAAGTVILVYVRKVEFWEPQVHASIAQAERGDRSFWLITAGMVAVFYLSPLEFLYVRTEGFSSDPLEAAGAILVAAGIGLFAWSRTSLGGFYSGHLAVLESQTLVNNGPYRLIRHPAYAGYLLAALGLALGYASIVGAAALFLILLPAIVWRIHIEEGLLRAHFGAQFEEYSSRTRRLVPWAW
ncbi:MAG TPA: isoprenylcysteine carboxylmethyltransferase family protein [Anaerolineales bacterium]